MGSCEVMRPAPYSLLQSLKTYRHTSTPVKGHRCRYVEGFHCRYSGDRYGAPSRMISMLIYSSKASAPAVALRRLAKMRFSGESDEARQTGRATSNPAGSRYGHVWKGVRRTSHEEAVASHTPILAYQTHVSYARADVGSRERSRRAHSV